MAPAPHPYSPDTRSNGRHSRGGGRGRAAAASMPVGKGRFSRSQSKVCSKRSATQQPPGNRGASGSNPAMRSQSAVRYGRTHSLSLDHGSFDPSSPSGGDEGRQPRSMDLGNQIGNRERPHSGDVCTTGAGSGSLSMRPRTATAMSNLSGSRPVEPRLDDCVREADMGRAASRHVCAWQAPPPSGLLREL